LSQLQRRGGKLIVYHGWNDPSIPPMNSVDTTRAWCRCWAARKAARARWKKRRCFFRLYMVPGMTHCSGDGTDRFDMLTALEAWVEKDVPPARIVASHQTDGKVDRTRPLCRIRRSRHIPEAAAPMTRRTRLPRRAPLITFLLATGCLHRCLFSSCIVY